MRSLKPPILIAFEQGGEESYKDTLFRPMYFIREREKERVHFARVYPNAPVICRSDRYRKKNLTDLNLSLRSYIVWYRFWFTMRSEDH